MTRQCIYVLLITSAVCCALTEKREYTATSDVSKKHPTEDRLLANIVRARNSSKALHTQSNDSGVNDTNTDKKPRTAIHGSPGSQARDNCCGSRFGSASSSRPDPHYNRIPGESGRYPSQYGERVPVDRYGWQTQGRPPGSSGNSGKPSGGNYGGTAVYAGAQAGDRFSPRPGYGSGSSSRPGGYGSGNSGGYGYSDIAYGGYGGRPSGYGGSVAHGSYGVSGTLADGDEFGPGEGGFPEGGFPEGGNGPTYSNLQTQKAMALKALAGVALIGAAAALATNPVLLPIGIVSGRRRKRSESSVEDEHLHMDYILQILNTKLSKVQSNGAGNKLLISPRCVARLTCEIQKTHMSDLRRDFGTSKATKDNHWNRDFANLVRNNVLNSDSINGSIKKLIRMAISVASSGRSCQVFTCNSVRTV